MTTSIIPAAMEHYLVEALKRERGRLLQSLHGLEQEVVDLTESQADEGSLGNAADMASDLVEASIDVSLEHSAAGLLEEVEQALKRHAEGAYGICTRCGAPIAIDRLEAIPWARFCRLCAGLAETTPHTNAPTYL